LLIAMPGCDKLPGGVKIESGRRSVAHGYRKLARSIRWLIEYSFLAAEPQA
jgi:hypothetical protein